MRPRSSWMTSKLFVVPTKYPELLSEYALVGANLEKANLRGADLTDANLRGARFIRADLSRACLLRADCEGADFSAADMSMSYLRACNFSKARFWNTKLRRVTAKNAIFFDADLTRANVFQSDFLGCRWNGAILDGITNADWAVFFWYMPEGWKGMVRYRPGPGLNRLDDSYFGGYTLQENAARQKWE